MRRRDALAGAAVLALAGCEDDPPAPVTQPDFRYLTPLILRVGAVETAVVAPPPELAGPIDPVAALLRIAADRMQAAGGDARAVYTVTEASLRREGDGVAGRFGVTVRILDAGGRQAAEATALAAGSKGEADPPAPALAALTRQLLDAMNVELEFQMRRTLGDWLIPVGTGGPAVPAPVTQTPL